MCGGEMIWRWKGARWEEGFRGGGWVQGGGGEITWRRKGHGPRGGRRGEKGRSLDGMNVWGGKMGGGEECPSPLILYTVIYI